MALCSILFFCIKLVFKLPKRIWQLVARLCIKALSGLSKGVNSSTFFDETSVHVLGRIRRMKHPLKRSFWLIVSLITLSFCSVQIYHDIKLIRKNTFAINSKQVSSIDEIAPLRFTVCYKHWIVWFNIDIIKSQNLSKDEYFALLSLTQNYFVFDKCPTVGNLKTALQKIGLEENATVDQVIFKLIRPNLFQFMNMLPIPLQRKQLILWMSGNQVHLCQQLTIEIKKIEPSMLWLNPSSILYNIGHDLKHIKASENETMHLNAFIKQLIGNVFELFINDNQLHIGNHDSAFVATVVLRYIIIKQGNTDYLRADFNEEFFGKTTSNGTAIEHFSNLFKSRNDFGSGREIISYNRKMNLTHFEISNKMIESILFDNRHLRYELADGVQKGSLIRTTIKKVQSSYSNFMLFGTSKFLVVLIFNPKNWLIDYYDGSLSWSQFISNIGGSLGIWTGSSIISLVHILTSFISWLKRSICRRPIEDDDQSMNNVGTQTNIDVEKQCQVINNK